MPAPNRIEVRIGGSTYAITIPGDEVSARRVCNRADQLVRRILQANPALNQNAALVLALVNAIDEGQHLEARIADLEARLEGAESRAAEARAEMLRMKAQADAAAAEVARLHAQEKRAAPRAPWLEGVLDEPPADRPEGD